MNRYRRSIEINRHSYGMMHPRIAAIYVSMGTSLLHQKKWRLALDYQEKAIAIYRNLLGDRHPDLARAYQKLGQIWEKQEFYQEALEANRQGLESLGVSGLKNDPGQEEILKNSRIEPILAELLRERAALIRQQSPSVDTDLLAMSWYRMASAVTDSLRVSLPLRRRASKTG